MTYLTLQAFGSRISGEASHLAYTQGYSSGEEADAEGGSGGRRRQSDEGERRSASQQLSQKSASSGSGRRRRRRVRRAVSSGTDAAAEGGSESSGVLQASDSYVKEEYDEYGYGEYGGYGGYGGSSGAQTRSTSEDPWELVGQLEAELTALEGNEHRDQKTVGANHAGDEDAV